MTREEAIEIIECGDISNRWGKDGEEVEKMAIKTLEQEPKAEVLDKIRAEIDSHCSDNRDRNDGLYIAMKIIDKYKAESEEG